MARKKININSNPLEAVTIGRTDTKKHGWIGVLFLFVFFILIIYFLPDIQKAYKDYLYNKAFTNNYVNTNNTTENGTNTITNVTNNTENTENKVLNFTDNENVTIDDVSFTNVKFDAGLLTFLASNKSEDEVNLTDNNYFIRLYNENQEIIDTLKINGTLQKSVDLPFSFNLNVTPYKYSISKILEKDYDLVMLNVDENNKSAMNCHKDNESILYFFEDDKLYKLEDTINYSVDDDGYDSAYSKYNALSKTYENVTGLSTIFSDNTTSFRYRLSIDYNLYMQKIDNMYYYQKGASPIKISFEMKAMQFTCS